MQLTTLNCRNEATTPICYNCTIYSNSKKKEAEVRISSLQKNLCKSVQSVSSVFPKKCAKGMFSHSYTIISLNQRIAVANPFFPRPKK